MRGRVRIAYAGSAVHLEAEAARGGRRAGRVAEAQRVADPIEHLRVAQRDLARLAWGDGKDPGPQQAVAGQLDQGRVALAPHDLLVDRPRLRGVHRLPLELAISLPQREVAEHRLAGQRIEVTPLVHQEPRVPKPYFDGDERDTCGNRDLHAEAGLVDRAARERPHRLDPALGEYGTDDRAQCGGEPGQAFQGQHGLVPVEGRHERRLPGNGLHSRPDEGMRGAWYRAARQGVAVGAAAHALWGRAASLSAVRLQRPRDGDSCRATLTAVSPSCLPRRRTYAATPFSRSEERRVGK